MAPQDDLTAEWTTALFRKLDDGLYYMREGGKSHYEQEQFGVDLLLQFAQQTRQEALREARDYALACVAERNKQAFELTKTVLNDPRAVWLGCKASEAERIAEWIDRLASEGG